jgi:hypothetical protein
MVQFSASTVTVESDADSIVVGFSREHEGGELEYLLLTRARRFDEQDITLGMADVHVERNGQKQSGYGGVQRIELHRDHFVLCADDRLANRLGDDTFEVEFDANQGQLTDLRDALREVFGGISCVVEIHC